MADEQTIHAVFDSGWQAAVLEALAECGPQTRTGLVQLVD